MENKEEQSQRLQELLSKFMKSWSQLDTFKHKETFMDENEQVLRLRELWSRHIMTWGQVLIPSGAAIIAFFTSQAKVGTTTPNFSLLLIGCLLFSICMFYWRWIVHHIDEQIVGLYPVMLRLDSTNNWDTQTRYFFNNLANRSRDYLCQQLGLERRPEVYEEFVEEARRQGYDQYSLLLSVWRKYGSNSVSDRGHKIQDIAVFIVVVPILIVVLWIKIGTLALLPLFLFIFLVPWWGQRRGWWTIDTVQLWSSTCRLIHYSTQSFNKATEKAAKTGGKGRKRFSEALRKMRLQSQHSAGK